MHYKKSQHLKKLNQLIKMKHTMSSDVYLSRLKTLEAEVKKELINDIDVTLGENDVIDDFYSIIKPSLN